MWQSMRVASQGLEELRTSVIDLIQVTARTIVLVISAAFLLLFFSTLLWPDTLGGPVLWAAGLFLPTVLITVSLLTRRFWLAQCVWQMGLMATLTLLIYLLQLPQLAFLYAILPLMAVVTMGWLPALVVELALGPLLWWLGHGLIHGGVSLVYPVGVMLAGGLNLLLGWGSTRALLTATQWALSSWQASREQIREAQAQRLAFKETQEDLLKANRELARLTDRLKVLQWQADEARRIKEEFVANVSHELRTPLNMIIGFSEMLLQSQRVYGAQLPPQMLADIAAIERNSRHLSRLVDDVLDLSQIEVGRMALTKEWVDLHEIVKAALVAVRALYASKGLQLAADLPEELPPVFCDGTRVRQVLINLLSNAGRFTERGGVRVRIWQEGRQVFCSVTDTGPGIAPEDREKLFMPFQQLDGSIRRRHGGSGLGLSISKRFVEMHGGKMWLESPARPEERISESGGPGTTFSFALPLSEPAPSTFDTDDVRRWFNPYDEGAYRDHLRTRALPPMDLTPRYVVQEQGEVLQRLCSRYMNGAEVVAVRTREEALAELDRSPARAFIVNTAPGQVATETLLEGVPYETPVFTCWLPGEDDAARRLGVVRYLVKPVSRQELLEALDAVERPVRTVLLVDDEAEAVQLFSRMLASVDRGYRVLRARSGRQALRLMRQRPPDVLLLDLIMPGMDGFSVLEAKGADPSLRDIPVIVISSRDPANEPIVSRMLSVMRHGGLSVRDLFQCIEVMSGILAPDVPSARRGPQGSFAE